MRKDVPTLDQLQKHIDAACSWETCAGSSASWNNENPTWGHCAVAALLIQRMYGGELLRVSLEGTEFADARSHYFNALPGGGLYDATGAQFQGRLNVLELPRETRTRTYVLSGADTDVRYAVFAARTMEHLLDHPLRYDSIYTECLRLAYASPCSKAGFGAVVMRNGQRVTSSNNAHIPELASMCEPTCIRLGIKSRTESMLGACSHAEEWAIRNTLTMGVRTTECDLYVAGTHANGIAWFKDYPSFTCLRCAMMLNVVGINRLYVPTVRGWESLSVSDALIDARKYALGEK